LLAPNFWDWFPLPGWPGSPSAQVKEGGEVCITYAQPRDDRQWYVSLRRGFIDALTLTCADFLAHGPAIVAAQPVRRVTLSDKRPVKAEGIEEYTWACRRRSLEAYELPGQLFDAILPDQRCIRVRDGIIHATLTYQSEADAFAGLSRSCLRYARSPALPAPTR
jgi:hypothetical protein